ILLRERNKRTRPALDDKVILGWNALMSTALCKAFAATGNELYKSAAEKNLNFLLDHFSLGGSGGLYHTWKNEKAKYPAFLDDYAFLADALLHFYEISANTDWLAKARGITDFIITNFSENESGFFFYTKEDQDDIIVRKKEVYDGAVP